MTSEGQSSRVIIIVIAGLVVLGIIAWLALRARNDRATGRIVEATTTTAAPPTDTAPATIEPVTPAPRPVANALAVTPALVDMGGGLPGMPGLPGA